jgi:hypothetical protein
MHLSYFKPFTLGNVILYTNAYSKLPEWIFDF